MEKQRIKERVAYNNELKLKGFNVFNIEEDNKATLNYSRKDFYKICLTTGQSNIHYADRTYEQEGSILFFGNPHIPYSWETISSRYQGYTCLFTEDFLNKHEKSESLLQSPFFKLGGTPILNISEEQRLFLNQLFKRMISEQASDYEHKDELIRNYIELIIHEALKMQPSERIKKENNASERLTTVFFELLERQFPIENAEHPLQLKSAQDYANGLAVHVNSLNRAVKTVTGKSTSTLIQERIASEAKALLQHTNWNIAEIGFALGFEYPTYFNNFFKKLTGTTPKSHRVEHV
ncbi:transcriptional regulator, AraC family [Lishizhenia tianjinensis]|uniref:Transcriptional regulator, AraC family n=1 Tax=Lishizhenia tianjinensis TaxID=477690 RepID=A0A1I6Y909_9FLAO|nr:helix-turn-helix domain-containing protein [Lishizhenia tianjinensis]SFT46867.1 transcriptional regulator, AraC family [Lishizhenia tianjinensis]